MKSQLVDLEDIYPSPEDILDAIHFEFYGFGNGPIETLSPEEQVKALIHRVGVKIPCSVVLHGSGNGFNDPLLLGRVKTKILGVWLDQDRVMVRFKRKVWGSFIHEACFNKDDLHFPIKKKQGFGNDPRFTIS